MRALTARQRALSLSAAISSAGGMGLASAMTYPLVAVYLEGLGYSKTAIGAVAAGFSLGIFLGGPVLPPLLRRAGAVSTIAIGAALGALALVAFPFGAFGILFFLLRVVMGVGNVWHWVTGESWVNTAAGDAHRGKVVALYATLWGASTAAGPALLAAIGAEGVLPFYAAAGALALTIPPVILARRIAPDLGAGVDVAGVFRLVKTLPVAALIGFACGFSESLGMNLLPVYGAERGLETDTAVLLTAAFALGNFLLQLPVGWLADRMAPRSLVAIAALALALGAVAIPFAFAGGWTLWPVIVFVGGAAGAFYTLGLVLLGRHFGGGELASASAGFILSYTAGMTVSPPLAGVAMDAMGPNGLIAVWGAVTSAFAIGVCAYLVARSRRRAGA